MKFIREIRILALTLILIGAVGCDQASKHLARSGLGRHGSVTFPGGWGEFRLAENPGSFLSLGAALPEPVRVGILTFGVGAGLLLLLGYLARTSHLSRFSFVSLALVCAGGAGNLIDRITRKGLVTDFLFLRIGPLHTGVFNMADIMIMAGTTALVCELWRKPEKLISRGTRK